MSWAVMGDWERPYVTMAPSFVKSQLQIFMKLYRKGTLFQVGTGCPRM
jgi:isoleucyl-tRNA synthetase